MKMIVAVDKNWGIERIMIFWSVFRRHENVPYGDFRQGSCNGKEDSGKLSWRTAIKESY